MNRIPVVSSDLKSVGYDPAARVLEVEFKNKKDWGLSPVYQYFNVPPEVPPELYEGLIRAPSKGKFFSAKIRSYPQRYPYQQIQ